MRAPGFSGAALAEVTWDRNNPTCGGETCLVDHFQGRATCPYGQTESDLQSLPATDPARCRLPDAAGEITVTPVDVAVAPQKAGRRAEDVVYCSCECDGPATPGKTYCSCADGFTCAALDKVKQSDWFCVKDSVAYDPAAGAGADCQKSGATTSDCGSGRKNP